MNNNVIDMTWRVRYRAQLKAWRQVLARERRREPAMMPPPEMFGDLTPDEILERVAFNRFGILLL